MEHGPRASIVCAALCVVAMCSGGCGVLGPGVTSRSHSRVEPIVMPSSGGGGGGGSYTGGTSTPMTNPLQYNNTMQQQENRDRQFRNEMMNRCVNMGNNNCRY